MNSWVTENEIYRRRKQTSVVVCSLQDSTSFKRQTMSAMTDTSSGILRDQLY